MNRSVAVAYMVASSASWGLAAVASKGLVEHVDAMTLLSAQLFASVLFLWSVAWLDRRTVFPRPSAKLLAASLCGVLEPGLSYAVGLYGLTLTGATAYSLISATEPLLILFVAWLLLGQRPGARSLFATAVAIAGILLVSFNGGVHPQQSSSVGNALVGLGTLFAAVYVVLSSRFVLDTTPVLLSALQQSIGWIVSIGLLVLAKVNGAPVTDASSIEPGIWLAAGLTGIVQYGLAFWFYLTGLKALPVAHAALYLCLIPVFGVSGAVLFLGETVGARELIGSALVVAAIWIGAPRPR